MEIQIEVFDVGHGHCSFITAPNGQHIMVDCGTRNRDGRLWWPSIHHFGKEIAMMPLLNLDEDHLRDFASVMKYCKVRAIVTNPSIGPLEFQMLKQQGLGPGGRAYLEWLRLPRYNVSAEEFTFGGLQHIVFWNQFGGSCETTNDLSLAFFVTLGGFKMLFAGDLEAKGWRGMLRNPAFRSLVMDVNIFVASHHGRENGCCDELFELMNPEIVIISDDVMQHDTQETNSWYRSRCRGASLIADPTQRRYVMTTRNDGCMRVNAFDNGLWRLQPNIAVTDYPLSEPKPRYNSLLSGSFGLSPPSYRGSTLLTAR